MPANPLPLVVVLGPTAVGKTEISLQLAERMGGEIISADSRLFYTGMDIGTAKPSQLELKRVPHHLIDVANPDQPWSLAVFQDAVFQAVSQILSRNKLPILVGGTGQYIRALLDGWQIPKVIPTPALRDALETWTHEIGASGLHQRLQTIDPQAASQIDGRNLRRTIRALEVIFTTGMLFSGQRQQTISPYNALRLGLMRPRSEIYARIDARIEAMFEAGLVEEVKSLLDQGYPPDLPTFSAIGYRQVINFLLGRLSLEEAKVQTKRQTRNFVRRQANWFKESDPHIHWFSVSLDTLSSLEATIRNWIRENPLAVNNDRSNKGQERPWLKNYDKGVLHHLDYPAITVPEMFDATARQFPNHPCVILKNTRLSYREMQALIDCIAVGLVDLGIKKGDRVGLLMPNIPQFVMAYFAILKTGAIVVAINPLYKEQEIVHQVNDAGIEVILIISNLYSLIKALQPATLIRTILVTHPREDLSSTEDVNSSADDLSIEASDVWMKALLRNGARSSSPLPTISPEDDALFQYSGGTTGISKGAIATHKNLAANALQFSSWLFVGKPGQETVLMAIPLFHVYGMVAGMLFAIRIGASMVLIPNPRDTQEILRCIQEHQATFFPGVPTLFNAINRHPDVLAGKYNLTTIKACISGSAPLLRETKEKFESLTGGKLFEGYGLSEAPTATHCNPLYNENRSGSIGLPLPDVNCRVVSLEDGVTDLAPGEIGELLIQSPQVMRGYHNMPDETAQTLRDGWLYTGDIVTMDADGYFYIVDRKKELIKPGGFQVWPREIEEVIITHPKVMEVAVAGIPDAYRGEAVKAWVVLKPGESARETEIIEFCKKRMAPYKVPAQVAFRSELPKTTVGKILRRVLVQEHQASQRVSG